MKNNKEFFEELLTLKVLVGVLIILLLTFPLILMIGIGFVWPIIFISLYASLYKTEASDFTRIVFLISTAVVIVLTTLFMFRIDYFHLTWVVLKFYYIKFIGFWL
jgi:hypothetical protein